MVTPRTSTAASDGALLKTRTYTTSTSTRSRRRSAPTSRVGGCRHDGLLETAHTITDQPQFVLDFARQWQAAEKIIYSRTLAEPRSARTRIEWEFDPEAVRRLKADVEHDITVDGPELAAQAIRAGLVDEFQMIVCPAVVDGGKRFFPDGVRLDLELLDERRFGNGVLILRYGIRGGARGA
jgi:dihydrofolate reductase